MNNAFQSILNSFGPIKGALAHGVQALAGYSQIFFHVLSPYFGSYIPFIKVFSFVVSGILLYGILYTSIRSGYAGVRMDHYLDAMKMGDIFKRRSLRIWTIIKKLSQSKKPEEWRTAVFRAEDLLNIVFKQSGFLGVNFEDRLTQMNIEQLENLSEIKKAHEIIEKLHRDQGLEIPQEEVQTLLDIYETALKDLGLLG